MEYFIIKWIHILSSTLLFGTGIGSAFYMYMANRRKEIAGIYWITRHVVIADGWITSTAGITQLATGLWLLNLTGHSLNEAWAVWGLILYCFAGICWLPVVWLQIRMRDMAKSAMEKGQLLPITYWTLERWWICLGSLAFPALVVVFYLMVAKP